MTVKRKIQGFRASISLCLFVAISAANVMAGELPRPESEVLLTISGNITQHNATDADTGAPQLELDLAMIEALGAEKIVTSTPWTEGEVEFEGVLLSKLLEYVGAGSSHLNLTGLDGYSADSAGLDFTSYPVVIAYKRDSEYMNVRSLGPLWLMFPFDQHPALLTEKNKAAAVWQLISVVVR